MDKIRPLDYSEKVKINNLTNIINQKKIFDDNYWNIVKTLDVIEFGYSFTIGKYIILPETYIRTVDNDKLMNTLIHEKIHVNQRINQDFYNKIYKKIFG